MSHTFSHECGAIQNCVREADDLSCRLKQAGKCWVKIGGEAPERPPNVWAA